MSFCFSLNVICLGKVRQFLQSRVHLEELFVCLAIIEYYFSKKISSENSQILYSLL